VGRDGKAFTILKFRSMRPGEESWADRDRVTPVGSVMRRLSLDELPQVWNVLRGDMSLVGPRPERPEYAAEFARSIPGYAVRHAVRPGLTGLAQIRGWRGDTPIDERIRADREYVERRGAMMDLSILARTPRAMMQGG
jgi:lipopolysaccharide/colanic/teichoic acid biosynthesis glycosyltransferase